jgi:hypothetical protein
MSGSVYGVTVLEGMTGMSNVVLGVRGQRGGAVVVAVTLERAGPRVVLSAFVATGDAGDRGSLEPYHMAAEMPRLKDGGASSAAKALVAKGRARQEVLAAAGLREILATLKGQGLTVRKACLLVNRAGWMDDLLAYSLMDPGHPPVAEGLAVREALRLAFKKARLVASEMDEKSLPGVASQVLGMTPGAIEARMQVLGASAGRPWRKEQKLACLAAWVTCQSLSA